MVGNFTRQRVRLRRVDVWQAEAQTAVAGRGHCFDYISVS